MAQENQQNNYADPASLPVRRKRGRPRKDEVPVSELSLRTQQQRADSPADSSRGLVGRPVSGILDGTFEAGYMLTVRVGATGPVFRGIVFDPRLSLPVSAENDIAPNLPMLNQNVTVSPATAEASNQVSVHAPDHPAQQNVRAVQPLPRYEPASDPTPAQSVQQNVRAVQPIQRNEPASVRRLAQPVQQNVSAFQPIQRNEPAAVHAPAVPVQQNVRAVQPLHRNEPTAIPTTAVPVQQNVRAVRPIRRNEPAAVHIPAQLVQQNVRTVEPLPRDEPAAVLTPVQPVQPNVKAALPLPRITLAIPSQLCQTDSSLYREKVVLNDGGRTLQSDSRPRDSQAIPKVAAGHGNPSASAAPQPLRSEIKRTQTATSEGPLDAVKEEEIPATIPASDHQTGEGVEARNENEDPQRMGGSSGSTSQISGTSGPGRKM